MNTAALRVHLDGRLQGMQTDRITWWWHWRKLAEFILPRRMRWLMTPNESQQQQAGREINENIIDSTASVCVRVLAAGMMTGTTSPARPWFRPTLGKGAQLADDDPVKLWLDEVQKRMLRVFAESNFYTSVHTMYEDLAVFGTAPMLIYEDYEDVIRCYNPPPGEYYAANSSRIAIDTLYREFTRSIVQLVQEFGIENCSDGVQSAYRTGGAGLSRQIIVCNAIEPNGNGMVDAGVPKSFPYRDVYWEKGSDPAKTLRITGFHECPFACPRWNLLGNDAYGRSPGMDALGDVKQLQLEQKRKAQAIDKLVNPPMVASVDLKNQPASLLPGGVTYVANVATAGFKPAYEVRPELAAMMNDIAAVQERIRQVLFTDLFLMISQLDTVRTATEIDARREEKLIQLGPVLERFQDEALGPIIDRTFAIMSRAGLIPPAPPEIQGAPIEIEYSSMLEQAQRAAQTTGMERLFAQTGNLAGAVPDILDNIDFDEALEAYGDYLGVSPKVFRPEAAVAEIRAQRARQMAAEKGMAMAGAGVEGAKLLSETDVGGGQNALQMALGNA